MIYLLYECDKGKELDHWLVKRNRDCGLESSLSNSPMILSAAAADQ